MALCRPPFPLMCPGLEPSAFPQRPEENAFAVSTHQVTHGGFPVKPSLVYRRCHSLGPHMTGTSICTSACLLISYSRENYLCLPPYRRPIPKHHSPGVRTLPFQSGEDSRMGLFWAAGCERTLKDKPSFSPLPFLGSSQFARSCQPGYCPNGKGTAPESWLKLSPGIILEEPWELGSTWGSGSGDDGRKWKAWRQFCPMTCLQAGAVLSTEAWTGINRINASYFMGKNWRRNCGA